MGVWVFAGATRVKSSSIEQRMVLILDQIYYGLIDVGILGEEQDQLEIHVWIMVRRTSH